MGAVSGRPTRTGTDSDETIVNRRVDPHWLMFGNERAIVGCFCGFPADDDDNGYGDSVVNHIAEVATREAHHRG